MYIIELVGGPMDGSTKAVPELELHMVVHGAPSLALMEKHKYSDAPLPTFKDYYVLVNPESDEGTKINGQGQTVHIYKFLKGPNVNPEL